MKEHKICDNADCVTVCIELNEREFVNQPVETVNIDNVKSILTSAGHDMATLSLKSGPTTLTNYTTKGWEPATLTGEWVFNKKIQKVEKKVEKNEIKSTPVTSNKRRRTKKK